MSDTPLTDENERFLPEMREGITSAAFTRNLERDLRFHTVARHILLDQLEELKERNRPLENELAELRAKLLRLEGKRQAQRDDWVEMVQALDKFRSDLFPNP